MAKKIYVGINNTAKNIKCGYIGIDGKARKIKKAYIGVGGVAKLIYESTQYILTLPAQSGTLTYNGKSQTPSWNSNYDSNKMTLAGTTSGTNATTYSVTFTPKAGYGWTDGTTKAKTVNWSIGKASVTLSASPSSHTFAYNTTTNSTKTVTISGYPSGATLSVSGGSTSTISASISSNVVTLKRHTTSSVSSTSITVTSSATTNYLAGSVTITAKANKHLTEVSQPSNKTATYTGSTIWLLSSTEDDYIDGDVSRTTVGTTTATLTPKSGYCWSGGSTSSITRTLKINKKPISEPSVSGGGTYTGKSQSASLSYDSDWCSYSGDTTGTSVKTYYVTFSLKDTANTEWASGGTSSKQKSWSITKANISISVSPTSHNFSSSQGEGSSKSFSVSGVPSEISAGSLKASVTSGSGVTLGNSYSDSFYATRSTDNSFSATVSVYIASTTNYNSSNTKTVTITGDEVDMTDYILTKPSSRTVTYTGKPQSLSYGDHMTYTGEVSGVLPRTYKATFKPESGYGWTDGTTDSVTATLTINKASANISCSSSSVVVGTSAQLVTIKSACQLSFSYNKSGFGYGIESHTQAGTAWDHTYQVVLYYEGGSGTATFTISADDDNFTGSKSISVSRY